MDPGVYTVSTLIHLLWGQFVGHQGGLGSTGNAVGDVLWVNDSQMLIEVGFTGEDSEDQE